MPTNIHEMTSYRSIESIFDRTTNIGRPNIGIVGSILVFNYKEIKIQVYHFFLTLYNLINKPPNMWQKTTTDDIACNEKLSFILFLSLFWFRFVRFRSHFVCFIFVSITQNGLKRPDIYFFLWQNVLSF